MDIKAPFFRQKIEQIPKEEGEGQPGEPPPVKFSGADALGFRQKQSAADHEKERDAGFGQRVQKPADPPAPGAEEGKVVPIGGQTMDGDDKAGGHAAE